MQATQPPPKASMLADEQTPLLDPHSGATYATAPDPNEQAGHDAAASGKFSTGLCACCAGQQGCVSCLISFYLPCLGHAIVADAASGHASGQRDPFLLYTLGFFLCPGVTQIALGSLARGKLRHQYGMAEAPCGGAHFVHV